MSLWSHPPFGGTGPRLSAKERSGDRHAGNLALAEAAIRERRSGRGHHHPKPISHPRGSRTRVSGAIQIAFEAPIRTALVRCRLCGARWGVVVLSSAVFVECWLTPVTGCAGDAQEVAVP